MTIVVDWDVKPQNKKTNLVETMINVPVNKCMPNVPAWFFQVKEKLGQLIGDDE